MAFHYLLLQKVAAVAKEREQSLNAMSTYAQTNDQADIMVPKDLVAKMSKSSNIMTQLGGKVLESKSKHSDKVTTKDEEYEESYEYEEST